MTTYDTLPARLIEAAVLLADRGDYAAARALERSARRAVKRRLRTTPTTAVN